MNTKNFIAFLVLLLWPELLLTGQSNYSFRNPEDTRFSLTFQLAQNLMIIPACINQSSKLQLVLDSGIGSTIISGLAETDTIQMKAARKIQIAGLGAGAPVDAYYSEGNQIDLGHTGDSSSGITGSNMDVYVLAADQFGLSRQLGIPVHGLLGSDLFKDFVVGIDPVRKEITFYNREVFNFKRRTRRFKKIPLTVIDGKAYLDAKMFQDSGSDITVRLLVDTGASLSFWISPIADPSITIPRVTVRSLLGQGMSGSISGVNGRVRKAEIGPFVFKKPLVSYPDSTSISGIALNTYRHGSVGNDILKRFSVIFDFQGSSLYLKPNKWFQLPFSYNRSGMEVEKPNPLLSVYSIYSIVPESPADHAGLKMGDLIENINSQPAFHLTLDEINNILYGDHGKRILLLIDRQGEKIKITFRLEPKI